MVILSIFDIAFEGFLLPGFNENKVLDSFEPCLDKNNQSGSEKANVKVFLFFNSFTILHYFFIFVVENIALLSVT